MKNNYLPFPWYDFLCSAIKQELTELEKVEVRINRMTELRNELQSILTEEKQENVSTAPWKQHMLCFIYAF